MTDTNFVACNVEKNGKAAESFMLKLNDGKIEDVLKTFSIRSNPDLCLEYRLENGAVKEEFVGKSFDDFKRGLRREHGETCRLSEHPISEKDFVHGKIAENMLTIRGEKTGEKILEQAGYNTLMHETKHQTNAAMVAFALSQQKRHP